MVRCTGATETRYSDRGVRVGDRLTIDACDLVVERVLSPSTPLATARFVCVELPHPPAESSILPEARQAA